MRAEIERRDLESKLVKSLEFLEEDNDVLEDFYGAERIEKFVSILINDSVVLKEVVDIDSLSCPDERIYQYSINSKIDNGNNDIVVISLPYGKLKKVIEFLSSTAQDSDTVVISKTNGEIRLSDGDRTMTLRKF